MNKKLHKQVALLFGIPALIIIVFGCFPSPNKNQCDCWGEFEKGKSIGRNAMMMYIAQTKQADSVTIDLHDLLKLEDSLDAAKTFEPKESDTIIQLKEK